MKSLSYGLMLFGLLALAAPVTAADDKPNPKTSYLTAEEAGKDFVVQGEYAAEGWGLQVIAEGDHKFRANLLKGGLPGAGWEDGKKIKLTGSTDRDGVNTTLEGDGYTVTLVDGKATVKKDDKTVEMTKSVRTSPTMGAKPTKGAKVLFDGTNTDHWVNGKMTDDMLLKVGTRTKDKFKNYKLHLEFRSPYMPYARGQARGNSGMYLGDQYECQILDSFGLDLADNECGGIYQNAKPLINMCFPPLSWQTYDVEFTAAQLDGDEVKAPAKVTILHNGVAIHKDREIKPTPGGGQRDSKPGALFLQDHGDAVHFRNIWLEETK